MTPDWFASPLYGDEPAKKSAALLDALRQQILNGTVACPAFGAFIAAQPRPLAAVESIEDLPFLPVSSFKREEPLTFLAAENVYRVLASSATTGQQPSRIAIDRETSRMMTKGVTAIVADFIGPQRRPYLIVDQAPRSGQANARSAAIQGLLAFSTDTCYALRPAREGEEFLADPDGLVLDLVAVEDFCRKHAASDVVAYGFTYVVYLHLGGGLDSSAEMLSAVRQRLGGKLLPHCHLLHSGGWKKLQQLSVNKETFNRGVASAIGCDANAVIDY